jgi:4-amino-4-deoxy-L-arabinose transferase-like glycosyltransferase
MPKQITLIFALIAIVCAIGWGIDLMDIDAAQYASMSREMMQTGHYLQVYDLTQDYLDKPPFLFWVSALSMKIFGINGFAYRLPSFLFAVLAVYSTYRLGRIFYLKEIAIWSALILAGCQAFFLMNHDVRTDTILMGWVIFSLWQLAAWFKTGRMMHCWIGFAAIAGGMMTKGPIALLVPIFAFGTHFLLQRQWKNILKWQYLAGLILIAVLLMPMSIGLYRQFDQHPEKLVNGAKNVSGLRFFYWTQSFGRITGESTWNNNSNIFFLLQNMLWAFLPWIIFFLMAFFSGIKEILQQKFRIREQQEAITTGGFLLTYLSLGMSKYQLPHYIFVVFPLAAIITARYLHRLLIEKKQPRLLSLLKNLHYGIFILLWLILLYMMGFTFETIPVYAPILALAVFAGLIFMIYKNQRRNQSFFFICLYGMIGINFFLNAFFYPSLLQYQAGSTAGKWLNTQQLPAENTFLYQYTIWRSLSFNAKGNVLHQDSLQLIKPGSMVITSTAKMKEISQSGRSFELLHQGVDYPVSRLKLKFLNPGTRANELTGYVILKMK